MRRGQGPWRAINKPKIENQVKGYFPISHFFIASEVSDLLDLFKHHFTSITLNYNFIEIPSDKENKDALSLIGGESEAEMLLLRDLPFY